MSTPIIRASHSYDAVVERLALSRERLGWAQDRLAYELGYNTEDIAMWETGAAYPSVDVLLAWSNLLGLELGFSVA